MFYMASVWWIMNKGHLKDIILWNMLDKRESTTTTVIIIKITILMMMKKINV